MNATEEHLEYLRLTAFDPPKRCTFKAHDGSTREVLALNFDWPHVRIQDGESTYWTSMLFVKENK
jgi:hypothetical protein